MQMASAQAYQGPVTKQARAAQVWLCVIAALLLCDYAQLRISASISRVQLVAASSRLRSAVASNSTPACSGTQQQQTPGATTGPTTTGLVPVRMQSGLDNPLFKYWSTMKTSEGPVIHKWDQYFDVYHRYFQRFIGKEVHMMEIGIQSGGSLGMWKSYFGPNLRYYGVDINPYTKMLFEELPNTKIFIGSQTNRAFWAQIRAAIPKLDFLLDDGGHTMEQQITTFQEMYEHIKDGGVYMVEDCATSYRANFGGGLKRNGTWIEYAKGLVDEGLNADYYKGRTSLTASITSIAFYDQIVVFEKGNHADMSKFPEQRGTMKMDYMPPTLPGGRLDPNVVAQLKELYKKP